MQVFNSKKQKIARKSLFILNYLKSIVLQRKSSFVHNVFYENMYIQVINIAIIHLQLQFLW